MTQRRADGSPDLVAAAAAYLYGLPPGEFTAARTEHVRQARASGDRAAATAIGKLGRPSTAAWLANLLVREHAAEIGSLLELGAAMRTATAALDAATLRQLSRQQQQAIRSLIALARDLAGAAGQGFTDSTARGLDGTLHAALADEQAASQLSAGCLTAGLVSTGFPGIEAGQGARLPEPAPGSRARLGATGAAAGAAAVPAAAAPATAEAAAKAAATAAAAEAARQEQAARDQDQARSAAQDALLAYETALASVAAAGDAVRAAEAAVGRLRSELDAALAAQAQAQRAQRQATSEAGRAEQAARRAERRLADAVARVAET